MHDGISCYPTPSSAIADVVQAFNEAPVLDRPLETIRLSFSPNYSGQHTYNKATIQYVLDHTPANVVVVLDVNHKIDWNPIKDGHEQQLKDRLTQVCIDFPDSPRIVIEPFNEINCTFNEFYDYAQRMIDHIRGEDFTHTLVINKLYTSGYNWKILNDPLDKTFQGYHVYFRNESVSVITDSMQAALDMGIKILNTETGPNSFSPSDWEPRDFDRCNEFYQWCAPKGVRNLTWISWADIDENWFYLLVGGGLIFSYETDGGETLANVVFSGEVKDVESQLGLASLSGTVEITYPDNSKETLQVVTDTDGLFQTSKEYPEGSYSAIARFSATGYNPADSPSVPFTIEAVLKDMVVTLNVSVA